MIRMTVSEARSVLPEILDRVGAGEEVTLTRHGRPVAVIVRPDTLRARRANNPPAINVTELLAAGRRTPLPAPSLTTADAEALAADVRRSRSSH